MTTDELKKALLSGESVDCISQYGEIIRYSRINAVRMYREKTKEGYKLSFGVELLDENNNSVTIVPAKRVIPAVKPRKEESLNDNRKNKD